MAAQSRLGNIAEDVAIKAPVRVASSSNITLSGLQTIDSVALAESDRVLVMGQTDQTQNGIYLASSGDWIRTADASKNTDFLFGTLVFVVSGSSAGVIFSQSCTDNPVVIGTSLIAFSSQSAVANAAQQATSATSAALTIGAKTFATQAGKSFSAKQWVLIYETSNPDNNLLAQITSYSSTSLVTSVTAVGGAGGPFTDWTIVLVNSPPSAGRVPPAGTGNVTGPGSSVSGNLPKFADTTGKVLSDSGIAPGTLAGRNTLQSGDAGTSSIQAAALQPGAAPLANVPVQTSENLAVINDATNPNTDINVIKGRVRDDSDVTNLQIVATMVKRLDAAWAAGGSVGNRKGALDTGSALAASKTYNVYQIGKLAQAVTSRSRTSNVATLTIAGHGLGVGGTVRAQGVGSGYDGVGAISAVTTDTVSYANTGADEGLTSATGTVDGFDILASRQDLNGYPSPSMPSGWTVKQFLWAVLTDGSGNIYPYNLVGDQCTWKTQALDGGGVFGLAANAATLITMRVPLGAKIEAKFNFSLTVTGIEIVFLDPAISDQVVTNSGAPLTNGSGNANTGWYGRSECLTDTSGRIRAKTDGATGANCYLATLGYRETRRRLF